MSLNDIPTFGKKLMTLISLNYCVGIENKFDLFSS